MSDELYGYSQYIDARWRWERTAADGRMIVYYVPPPTRWQRLRRAVREAFDNWRGVVTR